MPNKIINVEGLGEIEYLDDLPFGIVSQIVKNCVDIQDITKPKVDADTYQYAILTQAIVRAPFNPKNLEELKAVPSKKLSKVISEVMKEFPLVNYVDNWMISLMGMNLADSEILYTPNVPSTSVGTNAQLTLNQ